jgi:hypothetical protein
MSDRDAEFAEYFAARSGAMRGTAYLLCGDWHRAEDLVQVTFTKLYLAWRKVSRHEVIGLTAGASTPGELVDGTIEQLGARGYDEVIEITVAREDVHFRLPREVASG